MNNESDMNKITRIYSLCELLLSARQSAWEKKRVDISDIQKQVDSLAESITTGSTEDDVLKIFFLQRFAAQYLKPEQKTKIGSILAASQESFPILKTLRETLGQITTESSRIFINSGDLYTNQTHAFTLPTLSNPVANTLIDLECRRMQVDLKRPELKNYDYQIKSTPKNDFVLFELSKNGTDSKA